MPILTAFAEEVVSSKAVVVDVELSETDQEQAKIAAQEKEKQAKAVVEEKEKQAVLAKRFDDISIQLDDLENYAKAAKKQFTLIKKSDGEERALVAMKMMEVESTTRKILDDIINELEQLSSEGQEVSSLMNRVKSLVKVQSVTLISEIRFVNKLVRELRPQRETVDIELLFALEQRLNKLRQVVDGFYLELLVNTKRNERVELDAREDLAYLDKWILLRVDSVAARLKLASEQVELLQKQLTELGKDRKIELELRAAQEKKSGFLLSLTSLVAIMKDLGLESTQYSQLLVSKGEIQGNLDSKVVLGLVEQWFEDGKTWFINNASRFFIHLLTVFAILLLFKLIAILAKRVVQRALQASDTIKISKLLQDFFISMVGRVIMLIGVLIALSQLGIQIGALLAGLGVVGFIVGFALQDTLSNFASGLMILLYRPFDVGDIIEVAGLKGVVREMSLVSTTVFAFNNEKLVIPNNKIWGDTIRNITSEDTRRVDFSFPVGHGADIEKVEQILQDIVAKHDLILTTPETVIKLHELDELGMRFIIRAWVNKADYWTVYWDIMRNAKMSLEQAGIARPFPRPELGLGS